LVLVVLAYQTQGVVLVVIPFLMVLHLPVVVAVVEEILVHHLKGQVVMEAQVAVVAAEELPNPEETVTHHQQLLAKEATEVVVQILLLMEEVEVVVHLLSVAMVLVGLVVMAVLEQHPQSLVHL
jgi:hypothetical protein